MNATAQTQAQTAPKTIVAGGGYGGLVAAWIASQAGAEVSVLEAGARLGGVHFCMEWNGFTMDMGCHTFGAETDEATDLLLGMIDQSAIPLACKTQSITNGGFTDDVEYPNLSLLGPDKAANAMMDLLQATLANEDVSNARTLEEFLLKRFGSGVTEMLRGPLRKMLRRELNEISPDIAPALPIRRVMLTEPDLALMLKQIPELDDRLMAPAGPDGLRFHSGPGRKYPGRNFYPLTGGMGGFTSRALKNLEKHGVNLETGKGIKSITPEGSGVRLETSDGKTTYTELLIWTGNPVHLAQAAGVELGEGELFYNRPLVLYYLDMAADDVSDIHYVIDYSENTLVQRASIPPNYGPNLAPKGRAFVCLECATEIGSDMWENPESYYDQIIEEARGLKLISGHPSDRKVVKSPISFKLPSAESREVIAPLNEWLARHPQILMPNPFAFSKSGIARGLIDITREPLSA